MGYEDLTGRVFGRWTVTGPSKRTGYWDCICECGGQKSVRKGSLTCGDSSSCGCYGRQRARECRTLDLRGQRFGRLTAIEPAGYTSSGHIRWNCLCDCGNAHMVGSSGLRDKGTRSCGCWAREAVSARNSERLKEAYIHGATWLYEKDGVRMRMRSSWEVVFARWLDENNEPWEYEPQVFMLTKSDRYTPDFYLPNRDLWVEVKGFMSRDAARKIEAFRKTNALALVGKDFILKIAGVSTMAKVPSLVKRVA
jgi:hypothetical protein